MKLKLLNCRSYCKLQKQFIGLEETTQKLLPDEISCQVADGKIITAGAFESPETVKYSHDRYASILSANSRSAFCKS